MAPLGRSLFSVIPGLFGLLSGESVFARRPAILEPAPGPERPRSVIIEGVQPEVDGGRFHVKGVLGDLLTVEADVFADGHDELACRLLYRHVSEGEWRSVTMTRAGGDRWCGAFPLEALGVYFYKIEAWVDRFGSWRRDLARRHSAGRDLEAELAMGATLLREAAAVASNTDADELRRRAAHLESGAAASSRFTAALDDGLAALMARWAPRRPLAVYDRGLRVLVERERARFSAWYELFPRSTAPNPGEHGTFATTIARLPEIAAMGFDVLYLPPIHPIGRTNRKGKNNAPVAGPEDVGSPWAVGSEEGGHTAVHPRLGTLADFDRLVSAAREQGMEVALDLAFHCSPDHPYVRQHPRWFFRRPDGSIRFAENPPKQYEDVYPFDFETEEWPALWRELADVVRFWAARGVRAFRVDNPHTKPFPFWEWLIETVKAEYPDVIFLAEAFTTPARMYRLSKLGFSQSYTYFAWRNSKQELTEYLQEVTWPPVSLHFRPSLWPNTPDILPAYLQAGGPPAFAVRLVLAATLSASYGIYGPAFELCLTQPRDPGSEEYRDSEKYEVKYWDVTKEPAPRMRALISKVNRLRREHPALQRNEGLRFHEVDNDSLLAYSKQTPAGEDVVLVIVNLDPQHAQCGALRLPLAGLPFPPPYRAEDLLANDAELWAGEAVQLRIDPQAGPARIFCLRRSSTG